MFLQDRKGDSDSHWLGFWMQHAERSWCLLLYPNTIACRDRNVAFPLESSELVSRIVFNLQQCVIVSDVQLYPVKDHSSIVKIYSFSRSHLDVKYFDMLPRQSDLGPQVLALNLSSEFQSDSYHNADSKGSPFGTRSSFNLDIGDLPCI